MKELDVKLVVNLFFILAIFNVPFPAVRNSNMVRTDSVVNLALPCPFEDLMLDLVPFW